MSDGYETAGTTDSTAWPDWSAFEDNEESTADGASGSRVWMLTQDPPVGADAPEDAAPADEPIRRGASSWSGGAVAWPADDDTFDAPVDDEVAPVEDEAVEAEAVEELDRHADTDEPELVDAEVVEPELVDAEVVEGELVDAEVVEPKPFQTFDSYEALASVERTPLAEDTTTTSSSWSGTPLWSHAEADEDEGQESEAGPRFESAPPSWSHDPSSAGPWAVPDPLGQPDPGADDVLADDGLAGGEYDEYGRIDDHRVHSDAPTGDESSTTVGSVDDVAPFHPYESLPYWNVPGEAPPSFGPPPVVKPSRSSALSAALPDLSGLVAIVRKALPVVLAVAVVAAAGVYLLGRGNDTATTPTPTSAPTSGATGAPVTSAPANRASFLSTLRPDGQVLMTSPDGAMRVTLPGAPTSTTADESSSTLQYQAPKGWDTEISWYPAAGSKDPNAQAKVAIATIQTRIPGLTVSGPDPLLGVTRWTLKGSAAGKAVTAHVFATRFGVATSIDRMPPAIENDFDAVVSALKVENSISVGP